jgi:ADP-heptose:LPS heptosyltransferase
MSGKNISTQILVIKLSALGDFVQALGPMKAIRDHHTDAQITLLTTAPYAELGRATGYFHQVWVDDRPSVFNLSAWWSLRRRLGGAGFARVYDLQTSSRSNFYYRALFGEKPEWSGVASGCSHPHNNPQRDFIHTLDRQREQMERAGIEQVPLPSLDWADTDLSRLGLTDRFGLLVPGGAAHRPAKRWPIDAYGELSCRLDTAGVQPIVIGAPGEESLGQEISQVCPSARDLVGQTSLTELAALACRAELAIGNDTGPMHMAAVAGCRTIVLFSGESDPTLCAPRGSQVKVLRRDNLADLPIATVVGELEL